MAAFDREGGQLSCPERKDQIRPAFPEADVLDVGARRPRGRRDVRVEDRELVAVVLEEPNGGIDVQLEAVRGGRTVAAGFVAFGLAVTEDDDTAGLVRRLGPRVLLERAAHLGSDHHQRSASISPSTSSASQKEAERYFQPASARIATTTPSSRSAASLWATWMTAAEETPAKTPSSSRRARTPATASAFETSSFRSSVATSRIGGT